MIIAGFQPFSLIDYPGKSCSIVFTQGCPFRCPYCHNPELLPMQSQSTITEESVLTYLVDHKQMLDGLCITGGEPTIQIGLRAFLKRVKELGFLVKLDTNGIHPKLVHSFISDHLVDYIAMDVKHRWEKYADIVRRENVHIVENCRETLRIIQRSGIAHEFRTTICPGVHAESDFFDMAGYLQDGETYIIQETRFMKTLEKNIPQSGFHAEGVAEKLREMFPRLIMYAR